MPTSLLPVLNRSLANAQDHRKFVLRHTQSLPNGLHLWVREIKFPGHFPFAFDDSVHLLDAVQQLIKRIFVHGYHLSTIAFSCFNCAGVRLSCLPLGYTYSIRIWSSLTTQ